MVKALGIVKGEKYNLGALVRDVRPENAVQDRETLTLLFTHADNLERFNAEYVTNQAIILDAIAKHIPGVTTVETR